MFEFRRSDQQGLLCVGEGLVELLQGAVVAVGWLLPAHLDGSDAALGGDDEVDLAPAPPVSRPQSTAAELEVNRAFEQLSTIGACARDDHAAQAGVDDAPAGLEAHVQVLDLATRVTDGLLRGQELSAIVDGLATANAFPAELLATLGERSTGPETVVEELRLTEFREGMWLRSDVFSESNVMLASANTCLTGALLERLRNYARATGVRQPVLVEYEATPHDDEI